MKSYDATDRGSKTTRCGNCGRLIRAHASDTERVSIPLRFLLYPIPIISYVLMAEMVKRFCCLPCKEQYEASHPNAWKSTFWWIHGILFITFGIPVALYVVAFMAGAAPSPTQLWEEASAKVEKVNSDEEGTSSEKTESKKR